MLLNCILCACLAWVLVYPLRFIRFKYKPFNCEKCLAGWFACGVCFDGWHTPLWMAGAMVAAVFITRQLNK